MPEKNVAQRVCIRIYHSIPREGGSASGAPVISKKERRLIAEQVAKDFGAIKVYGLQDENGLSYDLFGLELYVFVDGSVIALESCQFEAFDSAYGHPSIPSQASEEIQRRINNALSFRGPIESLKLKTKCKLSLPKRGMPYEYLQWEE